MSLPKCHDKEKKNMRQNEIDSRKRREMRKKNSTQSQILKGDEIVEQRKE